MNKVGPPTGDLHPISLRPCWAYQKNPADRWQRSSFPKVSFYPDSVRCCSSSNICQRHLILALYINRVLRKVMTSLDKAQQAVSLLKKAILETITYHPDGIGSSDLARQLKLESDFEGNQKNYLSWSIIGLLVNEDKVKYQKIGSRKLYFINT